MHWRLNDDFDINQRRRRLTQNNNIRIGVSVCVSVCLKTSALMRAHLVCLAAGDLILAESLLHCVPTSISFSLPTDMYDDVWTHAMHGIHHHHHHRHHHHHHHHHQHT